MFAAFKRYVVDNETAVETLVPALRASADTYRSQITASQDRTHPLGPVELFVYRSGTLESDVFKPLLIWLTDPGLDPIGDDQLTKAVASLESWMVRRALVRATTKSYNRFLVDLLAAVNAAPRSEAGDTVERFLASQSTPTSYWPGNNEVKRELENLPVYQRYRRGRLRMLLEAAEDHRRGFTGKRALHEQPVIRATCSIEHVLPQEWRKHWPAALTDEATARRSTLLQTLGNLTLVTQALNSRVSNGPWAGPAGKRAELEKHTSILLTRDVVKTETWDEEAIQRRTRTLVEDFLAIWTLPADLPTHNEAASARSAYRVDVADLVRAGFLAPGQTLYARPQAHAGSTGAITETAETGSTAPPTTHQAPQQEQSPAPNRKQAGGSGSSSPTPTNVSPRPGMPTCRTSTKTSKRQTSPNSRRHDLRQALRGRPRLRASRRKAR